MQRRQDDRIEWLEFELLCDLPRLQQAVFLRPGGYSTGRFAGLNTGLHTGDDARTVQANLELIELQLTRTVPAWRRLVWGQANHGTAIALVDAQTPSEVPAVDAIITQTPGTSLMMKQADCQVALFYDPRQHAAAAVHCGWRGSVANIYGAVVQAMREAFGCQPSDLLACVSPSLGPDEAEFVHYRQELPAPFWSFQVRPNYFDFWSISESQLIAAGLRPHHIEIARISTYQNPRDFYSYRRDKITGRHATCVTLL